jgi:aspartate/methionine/tyrosine aminotransferase
MYFHDPEGKLAELKECVAKETRIRLSANTPVQKAGAAALKGPQHHIREIVKKLHLRRDYAVKRLNNIDGVAAPSLKGLFMFSRKLMALVRGGRPMGTSRVNSWKRQVS